MIKKLTDYECLEFRKMNASFNDMVRAIYEAGAKSQLSQTGKQQRNSEMNNEEFLYGLALDSKVYAREAIIMNITEDILVAMEEKEITKAELARLLHKSKSFVTRTLSGSRNMTLRTLTDIAFNLDLAVSIVLKHKIESVEVELEDIVKQAVKDNSHGDQ